MSDATNIIKWGFAGSDEGTHVSSNHYVFFWTTAGQYIQWSGNYLYSDKPIRITEQPMVVITETK